LEFSQINAKVNTLLVVNLIDWCNGNSVCLAPFHRNRQALQIVN